MLPDHSLPNPCLALGDAQAMEQNVLLVDARFLRQPEDPCRRLVVGIDHTYLVKTLNQGVVRGKPGLVGGSWSPADGDGSMAFLPFHDLPPNSLKTPPAGMMLECLAWNPYADQQVTYSLASAPMSLRRAKDSTVTQRTHGNMEARMTFRNIKNEMF